jgi:hypothetical protein
MFGEERNCTFSMHGLHVNNKGSTTCGKITMCNNRIGPGMDCSSTSYNKLNVSNYCTTNLNSNPRPAHDQIVAVVYMIHIHVYLTTPSSALQPWLVMCEN